MSSRRTSSDREWCSIFVEQVLPFSLREKEKEKEKRDKGVVNVVSLKMQHVLRTKTNK